MANIFSVLGLDPSGASQILQYLLVAIPLTMVMFYVTTVMEFRKLLISHNKGSVAELIKKEFEEDNNLALSIFLGAKFIAITTIISFAMVFNLLGVVLFTLVGYAIQVLSVIFIEKLFGIEDLEDYILVKQNMPMVIFYSGLVIGLSALIGSLYI